ncbi:MAG: BamA/TamA family outer membrane protein, partial [Chitinophagales bacterium]
PVLYSSVKPQQITLLLKKKLQDNGHFHAEVNYEEIEKGKKTHLQYNIDLKSPYRIRSVVAPEPTQPIDSLIGLFHKEEKLEAEKGKVYRLEEWDEKRSELMAFIRNRGYYNFSKRYLYFYVDTSLGSRQVDIHIRSSASLDSTAFIKYYLRNISVNANYRVGKNGEQKPEIFNDITFYQDRKYIKPGALAPFIALEKGAVFSQKDHSYTLNQLLQLNIFKFVNIQYDKIGSDSLDVKILLSPTQYQDVELNLEASTTNTNFLGTNFQVKYLNRHLFKRAHQFELVLNAGSEFQITGERSLLNILDLSGQLNYYLPKMLGLPGWQKRRQLLSPRTRFSFTNNYQRWFELYTLNSVKLGYSYDWTGKNKWRHRLSPFTFTRVNLLNSDEELDELLESNPILRAGFEEVLIVGQEYSFQFDTKDPKRALREYWWLNLKLESAGNLLYGTYSAFGSGEKPYKPVNAPFSQFALADMDIRHYWIINENNSFVSRFNGGIGAAYGNSEVLPYIKQFYLGGPSTLRAFRFRGIGPGRYRNESLDNINSIDHAGDIKLLLNLEYRFTLYRFFKAAVFADIGNVWLLRADPDRQDGTFQANEFYRQLAVGSGLGLRLDFDIFVIRLDIGVPLRKPFLPEGQEWINDFPETGFKDWRKKNLVWNIAIGYPF